MSMMSGDGAEAWSTRTELKNNELEFTAQMVPNDPAIVAGMTDGVELTFGDIATQGRPGMVVKLSGTVQFGEQGSVDAPLSGTTCAWYRSWLTQQQSYLVRQPYLELLPSDRMVMLHGGRSVHGDLRDRAEISDVPFRVGDASGYLDIDPRSATVDTDVLTRNGVETSGPASPSFQAEWVLPLHQRVTVVGTLGPDLRLLTDTDHTIFVSTKEQQRIVTRRSSSSPARYQRRLRRLERRTHDRANRSGRMATRVQIGVFVLLAVVIVALVASVL